jgi:hypothetical protein
VRQFDFFALAQRSDFRMLYNCDKSHILEVTPSV